MVIIKGFLFSRGQKARAFSRLPVFPAAGLDFFTQCGNLLVLELIAYLVGDQPGADRDDGLLRLQIVLQQGLAAEENEPSQPSEDASRPERQGRRKFSKILRFPTPPR